MSADTENLEGLDPKPNDGTVEVDADRFAETERQLALENRDPDTEPTEEEIAFDIGQEGAGPTATDDLEEGADDPSVYWPSNDQNSPDYRHLDTTAPTAFDITPKDIELLFGANRFNPVGATDTIALAIRGAVLQVPHQAVRKNRIGVRDVRPTHKEFRCLLGFYDRPDGTITLFTGSTVPCPYYMREYYNRKNNLPHTYTDGCNMLPTGCYVFRISSHGGGSIEPALRMSEPDELATDAHVTVLRTENDKAYGTQDHWDNTRPYDNVHCSYFLNRSYKHEAPFSSAGCLTVRGRKTPSDQWQEFQAVLDTIGSGKRVDLVLLTGKEFAIAARLREEGVVATDAEVARQLGRLRPGSHGDEVTRLQQALGFGGSGYFGRNTKERLALYQRQNGVPSDGVFSPALDAQFGWGVFAQAGG